MEYLSQKGVPFTEKNVSRDQSAVQELMSMGMRSLPVIVIGDKRLSGRVRASACSLTSPVFILLPLPRLPQSLLLCA